MHDQRVDIRCGNLGAVAIAAEGLLDLGAVHSMALEEPVQLGVVLLRIDRVSIGLVVAQEELGHILAVAWKIIL